MQLRVSILLMLLILLNYTSSNTETGFIEYTSEPVNVSNNKGFLYSIGSGFSLIFISELGDRTFILAIFYTMKIGILPTFLVAATTLISLNVVWLLIGVYLPILIYKVYIDIAATLLFFIFAFSLLYDGIRMENKMIIEELKELQEEEEHENELKEVNLHDEDKEKEQGLLVERNKTKTTKEKVTFQILFSFSMTLIIAECGDRSQLTAIAIAALYDFKGVLIGSSLGHALATFIAVTIGYYFSEHVSEKIITLIGSFLFFVFAIDSLLTII